MDTRARCVSRAMPGGVRCVVTAAGIVLTVAGILLLLVAGTAYAHAPQAGTTYEDAYSSIFPHARSTRVQLMNSLRGYSYMVTDYNNARGHLTDVTRGYTAGNPVFIDNLPGDPQEPDVWIVETGSSDENVLNFFYGFPPCSSSIAWGQVYAVTFYGSPPHVHTVKQKVCIWPSRIGNGNRLGVNGQGYRWQYLTLEHELGHVLNLAHPTDSHSALMRDGLGMLELNTYERDGIRQHY